MVFYPPAWVPKLPFEIPDSIPISQFLRDPQYGRCPLDQSRNPFTCGISGKTYTASETFARSDCIAKALAKRCGWTVNTDTPWDKVVGVFALNTIDYIPLVHAIQRFNGIASTFVAALSAAELEYQYRKSDIKAVFTCVPLLKTALEAAKAISLPQDKIFIIDVPGFDSPEHFTTLEDLVREGNGLPELEPQVFVNGQGARQVAFLCYSSGTSGLPKAVMITHRNVIANTLQFTVHETVGRKQYGVETQNVVGVLPFSHIYGLVIVGHVNYYRGDQVIVLPKYDLTTFLTSIEKHKINSLVIVPPIVVQMLSKKQEVRKYNLSSMRWLYVGAAPTGPETFDGIMKMFPQLHLAQGYGMTETSPVSISTGENDILHGSSGCLLPGIRAKLIDYEGKEVTEYETRGELYIQSPTVTLGYLNNEKATAETFVWDQDGRWCRTGDEVIVKKSPSGSEHIFIVDRIKELIKVKGHQVAPAELEAHLLAHSAVDDCAVIGVPHETDGEVPKAFVVKAPTEDGKSDEEVTEQIHKHVQDHKAHYKWLKGGIEYVESIAKTPSGKILRRMLRDKEREARRKNGGKL